MAHEGLKLSLIIEGPTVDPAEVLEAPAPASFRQMSDTPDPDHREMETLSLLGEEKKEAKEKKTRRKINLTRKAGAEEEEGRRSVSPNRQRGTKKVMKLKFKPMQVDADVH